MAVSQLAITIRDAGGTNRNVVYYLDGTPTVANVQAWLDVHLPLLDTIISGIITACYLTQKMDIGTLDTVAVNDMLVDDGVLFGWAADGTEYKHSFFVPTINLALIGNDKQLDSSSGVTDYTGSILAGGTGVVHTDKYGNELTSFLGGTRKKRK